MFDLRYHVTSLAAVFIALLIGILVGVALASHGLGNSERKGLEDDVRRAQRNAADAQTQVEALKQKNRNDSSFVDDTYNALMTDRLKDKRVAVLYVGSVDHAIQGEIAAAIKDAGGGTPARMYAVQVPIDAAAIDRRLGKSAALAKYAGSDHLRQLGQQLGRTFVTGGKMPIWSALHTMIVQEATPRFGASRRPVDAVIVVRTADPQTGDSAPFVQGLYQGLGSAGVPAVGVAQSKNDFTAKPVFQSAQLSTVDDVDLDAGKLALAIVLSTPASRADYGVNADDLMPPVTPVLTPSG
jgi:hypothetical protein